MNKSIIEITTVTGITLRSEQERDVVNSTQGAVEYFVNGVRVVKWTYRRTDDEFFTEIISIKHQKKD